MQPIMYRMDIQQCPTAVKRKSLGHVWLFATPWTIQPCNSPDQKTGVCSLSLLQGIFPTQGLNPGLPHCRQILYQLSHKGSPRILEWVAYPFSSGSSWPRNRTRVSCMQADSLPGELAGKSKWKRIKGETEEVTELLHSYDKLSWKRSCFLWMNKDYGLLIDGIYSQYRCCEDLLKWQKRI